MRHFRMTGSWGASSTGPTGNTEVGRVGWWWGKDILSYLLPTREF